MAEITARSLEWRVRKNEFDNVYLIHGAEGCLVRSSTDILLDALMPDVPDFNFVRIDGASCTMEMLEEEMNACPQFASHKLLVINDFSVSNRSESDMKRLCDLIANAGDECIAIFRMITVEVPIMRKTDGANTAAGRWKTFIGAVTKHGCVVNCKTPDRPEIIEQLCQYAQERGSSIREGDAGRLIDRVGLDLTRLLSEMDKLTALAAGKNITQGLIEKVVEPSFETNIFSLSRHVLGGNYDLAFDVLEKLFRNREHPDVILSRLQSAFIDLYRGKAAVQAGISCDEMVALYGRDYAQKKRFLAENAMRDSSRYSFTLLRTMICLVFDAAVKLHSSRTDEKIILEQLICKMCQLKREEGRN